LAVCHRRWGKDDLALHWTAVAAHTKVASYWHMLPQYEQARKAIWTAVNPHTGIRRIDEAFPLEIRDSTNEQAMFIRFKNGSTWQVVGSDNYNSLVGAPPAGLVVSEWALADPAAWAYLSPILAENNGWALFLYTSRGKNHGHSLWQSAKNRPEWHVERQSVDDTRVFSPQALAEAKADLIALYGEEDGEALYDQEYFCSFEAAIIGSYYGRIIARLEREGKVTAVPYNPEYPVMTSWDLGLDDSTAVWFAQIVGREVRIIDHLEARNRALTDVAREVLSRGYVYAEHYGPHDIDTREMTSAKTRKQTLEELNLRPIRAGSKLPVADGINAVRNLLPRCVFDEKKCEKGLNALRQYRSEWDDKAKTPRKTPKHDWSSHSADSFRELAVQLFDVEEAKKRHNRPIMPDYNPFSVGTPQFIREIERDEARYMHQQTSGMDWDPLQ
jgi:phage terminase large subunit